MNFDGTYTDVVKQLLNQRLRMGQDYDCLLDLYTLLAMTVGENCTDKNVHDAWSIWKSQQDKKHPSLVDFNKLSEDIKVLDAKYTHAIVEVAEELFEAKIKTLTQPTPLTNDKE